MLLSSKIKILLSIMGVMGVLFFLKYVSFENAFNKCQSDCIEFYNEEARLSRLKEKDGNGSIIKAAVGFGSIYYLVPYMIGLSPLGPVAGGLFAAYQGKSHFMVLFASHCLHHIVCITLFASYCLHHIVCITLFASHCLHHIVLYHIVC